jgi:hypothetical protein
LNVKWLNDVSRQNLWPLATNLEKIIEIIIDEVKENGDKRILVLKRDLKINHM